MPPKSRSKTMRLESNAAVTDVSFVMLSANVGRHYCLMHLKSSRPIAAFLPLIALLVEFSQFATLAGKCSGLFGGLLV